MKLTFPYEAKHTLNFGTLPTIKINLDIQSPEGFIPLLFLFDTGADVTSLPVSLAEKLKIDLNKCPKEHRFNIFLDAKKKQITFEEI